MINTRFWIDDYIADLDPVEKLLFLYFLTNPYTDICGVYEVPLKHIALETGLDKEMVIKIIARFEEDHKIYYENGWVAIVNFAKHQLNNPKVSRGIEMGLERAPENLRKRLGIEGKTSGERIFTPKPAIKRIDLSVAQRKFILNRDGNKCTVCGGTENLEIDHIKEVSKGGDKKPENLRTLCQKCHIERHKLSYAMIDHKALSHLNSNPNPNSNSNSKLGATAPQFTLKEEIKKMEENQRRDLNIIALYFEEKKPDINTKEQLSVAIKRHLRAAKDLIPFTDSQILVAVKKARAMRVEWTLETLVKILTK